MTDIAQIARELEYNTRTVVQHFIPQPLDNRFEVHTHTQSTLEFRTKTRCVCDVCSCACAFARLAFGKTSETVNQKVWIMWRKQSLANTNTLRMWPGSRSSQAGQQAATRTEWKADDRHRAREREKAVNCYSKWYKSVGECVALACRLCVRASGACMHLHTIHVRRLNTLNRNLNRWITTEYRTCKVYLVKKTATNTNSVKTLTIFLQHECFNSRRFYCSIHIRLFTCYSLSRSRLELYIVHVYRKFRMVFTMPHRSSALASRPFACRHVSVFVCSCVRGDSVR